MGDWKGISWEVSGKINTWSLKITSNPHFVVETNRPTQMNGRVVMLIYWRVYLNKRLGFKIRS